MERQPGDTNRVSKIRKVLYGTITKLGRDNKVNGRGSKEYEKVV